MTPADRLEALRGRIDLRRVPFTDHLSRLLLYAGDDGLWLGRAVYETPVTETAVLRRLRFVAGDAELPVATSARPDRVEVVTAAGPFAIGFVDPETLLLTLPAGGGIAFDVAADQIEVSVGAGAARTSGAAPVWLGWSGGTPELARSQPAGTVGVRVVGDDAVPTTVVLQVTETRQPSPPVPEPDAVFAAATHAWSAWLARAPTVAPSLQTMADHAWWILRANQILPAADPRRAGVAPSKQGYVAVWNWDSCFHALGLRHGDPEAAKDQLRIILAHQQADGMLPDAIHDHGVIASTTDLPPYERGFGLPAGWDPDVPIPITKPPLIAWAARAIWQIDRDDEFLDEVYEPIAHALEWWFQNADPDGNGIYEFSHSFSSGLDDSPLWDLGPPVESPELSGYLAMQCDEMALIAATIGRAADVERWRARAATIAERLVAQRWDDARGLFASTHAGLAVPADTPFGLLPLLTGRLPAGMARRLVATLTDPDRFWPTFPVPTVAVDDRAFAPDQMWRGPVWLNVNRLLIEGLRRSGFASEAAALRERTLSLALEQPDFSEYYNPLTGSFPRRAAPTFGWAAASFLDLASEAPSST
ncbi:MAG: hypothetical protein U0031_11895 [Thermomicrobiales bacterium]